MQTGHGAPCEWLRGLSRFAREKIRNVKEVSLCPRRPTSQRRGGLLVFEKKESSRESEPTSTGERKGNKQKDKSVWVNSEKTNPRMEKRELRKEPRVGGLLGKKGTGHALVGLVKRKKKRGNPAEKSSPRKGNVTFPVKLVQRRQGGQKEEKLWQDTFEERKKEFSDGETLPFLKREKKKRRKEKRVTSQENI